MTNKEKIDFILSIGDENNTLKEVGTMLFNDFDTQTEFESNKEKYNDSIVECKLIGKNWIYMRPREDKDVPNYISTYNNVIKSIEDDITAKVLIKAAHAIKLSWKDLK